MPQGTVELLAVAVARAVTDALTLCVVLAVADEFAVWAMLDDIMAGNDTLGVAVTDAVSVVNPVTDGVTVTTAIVLVDGEKLGELGVEVGVAQDDGQS